ncbi:hypothetical protein CEXT_474841 [Caerostris extrusa]|uniref:Uncharacterized protein n=1 Tax=Caerostris extrusa TaxID=172846 RepID=A0AAV4T821_CAEEX|nr:hypothetical protein CEXT_474841 [Caerostris extrusa]
MRRGEKKRLLGRSFLDSFPVSQVRAHSECNFGGMSVKSTHANQLRHFASLTHQGKTTRQGKVNGFLLPQSKTLNVFSPFAVLAVLELGVHSGIARDRLNASDLFCVVITANSFPCLATRVLPSKCASLQISLGSLAIALTVVWAFMRFSNRGPLCLPAVNGLLCFPMTQSGRKR